jgi:uncharacterized cupredoxin-like copper-binding protein
MTRITPLAGLAAGAALLLSLSLTAAVTAHSDESPVPIPSCAPSDPAAPNASPGAMGGDAMGAMSDPPVRTSPGASPDGAADACAGAVRIEVTLLDTMRMEPAEITVPAGVPVTFVVTNRGAIAHEFTLGDAADQQAHDAEMLRMGGQMMADEPNAIGVPAGATKELTWVFAAPGEMEAGCHVPGHYPAGMKMPIHVEG